MYKRSFFNVGTMPGTSFLYIVPSRIQSTARWGNAKFTEWKTDSLTNQATTAGLASVRISYLKNSNYVYFKMINVCMYQFLKEEIMLLDHFCNFWMKHFLLRLNWEQPVETAINHSQSVIFFFLKKNIWSTNEFKEEVKLFVIYSNSRAYH